MRVLYVDDDEMLRELAKIALEVGGAEAVCAASGEEALKLLAEANFDVFLLDVMMPHMDGCETLRRARTAGVACPAIFVTARVLPEEIELLLTAGACGLITKPFDAMTFTTTIAQTAGLSFDRHI